MSTDKPDLLSREEAQKLLDADRARQASVRTSAQDRPALMPNAMYPYHVYFVDPDIPKRPVIAWHPNGQPMVVDTERGMLVQALAVGEIERIELELMEVTVHNGGTVSM